MARRRSCRLTVPNLAGWINEEAEGGNLFWAAGLIKETLPIWQKPQNFSLLNEVAQVIARHYLIDGVGIGCYVDSNTELKE